jgi:carboxyl-terminal processing protease
MKTKLSLHSLSSLVTLALALLAGSPAAISAPTKGRLSTEQIREEVGLHCACTIDQQAEVSVPLGQAVQFDCADNPFLLKECLAYPQTNGSLLICYMDTDGELIYSTSTLFLELQGCLRQVADTPCLAIWKWELRDQALSLRLCLSTDKERNQRELDEVLIRKTRMSAGNKNQRPYPPQKLSETERLAGFARLWSEVKYNFAFFERVPELDWDNVLVEYLPKIQQAETLEDYHRTLARCLALLHDGHTDVGYRRGRGAYTLPLEVRPLDGKPAVIVRTAPAAAMCGPKRRAQFAKADLKPGEEITRIDGCPVKEILEIDLYPYICASSPQARDLRACSGLLSGDYGSTAVLTIRGLDGTEREASLTRGDYRMPRPRPTDSGSDYRELEGGLVYLNLPGFESDAVVKRFRDLFPQLRKAKGLILDIRENSGGSSGYGDAIISLLIDKPIQGSPWSTPQHTAAFKAWGRKAQWYREPGDTVKPATKEPFAGPVVVLTGPDTFSAAEDFAVRLHASKRATLVGERTGGSTGQPLFVALPGGLRARICTKHDTYPDGREFVGVGVIPDVEVHPGAAEIAAGRDVVLAKGIEVLQGKYGMGSKPDGAANGSQPVRPRTNTASGAAGSRR